VRNFQWMGLALAAWGTLASGCITTRRVQFPAPALTAPNPTAATSRADLRWALGEVHVEPPTAPNPQQMNQDWGPAQNQLEEHLKVLLVAQESPGAPVGRRDAEVIVDVAVKITETQGINGWIGLALAAQTAALLAGAGAGAVIGNQASPGASGLALGGSTGTLLAIPLAFLVSGLAPLGSVSGQVEYVITVRRPEGAVLDTRHIRGAWSDDLNVYGREDKLAALVGRAVAEQDSKLIDAVRAALVDVAPPPHPPGGFPPDAAPLPPPSGG